MAQRRAARQRTALSDRPVFDPSMRIVVLHGPDRYLQEFDTGKLVESLEKEYGEIEQFRFDGTSVEPVLVLDELRSYGLLQRHKLVILDDADEFLKAKDDEEAAPRGRGSAKTARALMERYAARPVDSATLLLRARTWRKSKLGDAIAKAGLIAVCATPTEEEAIGWCGGRCRKRYGCTIRPDAAALLVERIGLGLARLDVELQKMAAYVGAGGEIDPEAIRENVGLSREETAWVIQEALLSGSPGASVAKLRELLTISLQPEQLVGWAMIDLLRKLHGASRLLAAGQPPGAFSGQLKLWGPQGNAVLGVARRIDADRCAQLLNRAIEADVRNKSGLGRPPRTLEALAVTIADTIGSS